MRGVYRFLKSTILGGLVVLLPLIVVGALVAWAVGTARKAVMPILQWLPDKSIGGVSLALLTVIVGMRGLLLSRRTARGNGPRSRSRPIRRAVRLVDSRLRPDEKRRGEPGWH